MTNTMIPAAKPCIGEDERAAVDKVLRSGFVIQGPEVAAFEKEFANELVGGRTCVAVSSGTAGLHLGLLAAGVGPGDEVIVPSFTFAATANSVALTGATPVFVDIERDSFCMDPDAAKAAITPRTKGVMLVHLYGQPADMDRFGALAAETGIKIFEDAAQAHGAKWDGTPVGSFGSFGLFSLYPTKNMTSVEGGMVSCETPEIAQMIRLLRNQGMEKKYENEVVGFNVRMTDINAAIGRVQLGKLPAWTERRRAIAAAFDARLEGVVVPPAHPKAMHVYHQYTIRVSGDRDGFAKALLDEHGIGTGVYYPIPCHELPSFRVDLDLPVTRKATQEALSLPVYPSLTDAEVDRIVEGVNAVAKAGA